MRALTALAAAVADNLAPELNTIEAAATRLHNSSPAETAKRDDLQVIISNTKTAARILNFLASISSHRPIKPKVLHVGEVLESLHFLLARLVGSSVQVKIAFADDLWLIRADLELLEEAILALSVNARDAMAGGCTLKWSAANLTVTAGDPTNVEAVAAGDYVTIEAADTGCGIAADVLRRIFEPFFSTKPGRGNGTGLSMVYNALQQMNGHILIQSEIGKGTRVRLFIPCDEPQPVEPSM